MQTSAVCSTILAVGKTIVLGFGVNPTKMYGLEKYLPCLQHMLDGWRKEDTRTQKMLPVEADVSELLARIGAVVGASELQ